RLERIGSADKRVAAINSDPWAHQIQVKLSWQEGARRIGEARGHRRQKTPQICKSLQLKLVERVVRLICFGEMGYDEGGLECGKQVFLGSNGADLAGIKTQPVDAGLHMEPSRKPPPVPFAPLRPLFDLFWLAENRSKAMSCVKSGFTGKKSVEDIDLGLRQDGAKSFAFLGQRNEKSPASCRLQRRCNLIHAQPVGIGLYR